MQYINHLRAGWLFTSMILSQFAAAQSDMDAVLDGFGNEPLPIIELSPTPSPTITARTWNWHGSLGASASYNLLNHRSGTNTDYQGWSKLRGRLILGVERDFGCIGKLLLNGSAWHDLVYNLLDREHTAAVRDELETDFDILDAYVDTRINAAWDLRWGRQVVNGGFADSLRVLDILNPLDNFEPGLADIEDLRRPRGMLKLAHYRGDWRLNFILAPEHRGSRNPPYGSDYYSLSDAQGQSVKYREVSPDHYTAPDWMAEALGRFSGWDLSLSYARLWHETAYLNVQNFDAQAAPAALTTFNDDVYLAHSRIHTVGLGLQRAWGGAIYKLESRYLRDLDLTETTLINAGGEQPTPVPSRNVQRDRYDVLLGMEMFGWAQTTLALEYAVRYTPEFNAELARSGYQEFATETALRMSRDFLNARLRVTALAVRFDRDGNLIGADGGGLYRLNADYELADSLNLAGGIVWYGRGSQQPFSHIANNDRLYADLKWSF